MNFFLLFLGLVALTNLSLAFLVFSRNPHSWVNKTFVLFVGTLSFWTICVGMLFTTRMLIWSDLTLFFGNVLGVSSFILFSKHFPEGQKPSRKYLLFFLLFPVSIFLLLTPFRPFVSGIAVEENQIKPILGSLYPLLMLWSIFGALFGSFILFKKYHKSIGRPKIQLKYLFWGFLFFLFIVTFLSVILPAFGISRFAFFSPAASLVMVGSISYAIIRHRLMDIRLVVARTVSYSLLVVVLGVFYALMFAFLSSFYIGVSFDFGTTIISTFLALLMAFTFQPLRRWFEKATDGILYKEHYDIDKLLYDLALIMASTLRLESVTHGILKEIIKSIRISRGAFVLYEKGEIFDIKSEGFKQTPVYDELELKKLGGDNLLVLDELESGEQKDIMRELELSLVISMRTEGIEVGLLILGEKESGDIYSEQDLRTLETIASEAAVAIQNAKAYEEIRRFNITLQEEIDRATSELKNANEKLKELDKLKDEFVSLASHELRTPMTAIKGSISTILEGYAGDVAPQAKEFLTAAYNENDRLIRLVNNLLNISRIEAGRFVFNVTKVNMETVITEVVSNLQPAAKERNIYLKYEKDGKVPLVWADEDKVKEVVINLVGNATKFTHKGGITVKTAVKNTMLEISVTDTGSGIAPEDLDRLFKKFSQVGGNYSRPVGGTGLGLYISKQIVENLKGKIWLDSKLNVGTTFHFSLPIAN